MSKFLCRVFFFSALSLPKFALAAMGGEFSFLYLADTLTTSTTTTGGTTYYAADAFVNIDNKKRWYAGFHFQQLSITTESTTSTSFSSQDMGPFITWIIDHKARYSVTVGYNILASGIYTTGTTTANWTGSSTFASLGIMPEVGEDVYLGIKLNYYSATYSKQTIVATSSDIAYGKSYIFPVLAIAWRL